MAKMKIIKSVIDGDFLVSEAKKRLFAKLEHKFSYIQTCERKLDLIHEIENILETYEVD